MTNEEKRAVLDEYCNSHMCGGCELNAVCDKPFDAMTDGEVESLYNIIRPNRDEVNHPTHYCREGAMECFDEMLLIFGKDTVSKFCLCNAWKYRYRAADKNGAEDLAKSDWYMAKYRELTGSVEDVFKCSR